MLTHRTSLRGGITHRDGEVLRGDVLDHVQSELSTMAHDIAVDENGAPIDLPFAFRLGLVGYLGYEVDERRRLPRRNVPRNRRQSPTPRS